MKKILLVLLLIPFIAAAQRQTEYNRKGDEAMKWMDYPIAKFWYEEGVLNCDRYSIDQLTSIWMADKSMHVSMGPVMNKCQTCLTEAATERRDTLAMKKLITYYQEGIGIVPNEALAIYWKEQLELLRTPLYTNAFAIREPKPRMKFFVGYHASGIAPYGIQMGGIGETWGFYVRFVTNMYFRDSQVECKSGEGTGIIPSFEKDTYGFLSKKGEVINKNSDEKVDRVSSTLVGTAGFMFKAFSNVYFSVGAGYVKRDVFYKYAKIDPFHSEKYTAIGWAKNTDVSLNGVAVDIDATVSFAKRFYGTIGCSLLSFKKITPSIGIGVCF